MKKAQSRCKMTDVFLQQGKILLVCCLLFFVRAGGQTKTDAPPDSNAVQHFSFNGYLKDLNSFVLPIKGIPFHYENLIHNRLNAKWQSTHFNASAELRNRMLWDGDPRPSLYSKLERGWIEYTSTLWSIKAGRQRINCCLLYTSDAADHPHRV
jgi:hypothetical protein